MPHIYIREKDNTTPEAEDDYNVVYVPIVDSTAGATAKEPPAEPLVTVAALDKYLGDTVSNENIGYSYAIGLINLGLPVLPELVKSKDDINWDKLTDRGLYSIKFLTAGGLELDVSPQTGKETLDTSSMNKMLAAAAKRGDCIALLDHSKEITVVADSTYADAVRKDLGLNIEASSTSSTSSGALVSNANLKFGAAFSPWCTISGKEMPPSFAFLSAYAASVATNPNWYASAGKSRGVIPNITAVKHSYGDVEVNSLQARTIKADGDFGDNDNTGIAINPIAYIRAFGDYVVWGNRTLVKNDAGLTASSFLNIRNLCCDVKKELYSAARDFTFEQNDDILWANFSARIKPLLDKALSGGGIKGYKLMKEETGKRGRLKARVKIVPIEAVEDFDLTLELTDSLETVGESI
jgi:hypothetical protein